MFHFSLRLAMVATFEMTMCGNRRISLTGTSNCRIVGTFLHCNWARDRRQIPHTNPFSTWSPPQKWRMALLIADPSASLRAQPHWIVGLISKK